MEYDLTKGPVAPLMLNLAIPASVGFFFHTMYNVVDQFCAGRFISEDALAALTLAVPVFFILVSVSQGIYAGGTAMVSNAIGEGDEEQARALSAQVITAGLMASVVVTLVGWLVSPGLFRWLGAEGEYLALALEYMNVIFAGTIFFLLVNVLNVPLMARGNTKVFRNALILGFVLNVILDPLFIYWGFGLRGVAFATVLIQGINGVYIGCCVARAGHLSWAILPALRPKLHCQLQLMKYSVPAALNMATIAIGIFVITYFVSKFGVTATAAYGIATRVEQIALLPAIGLNIATLSMVGQNYGAREFGRVREVVWIALRYGLILWAIGGGLLLLAGPYLIRAFLGEEVVENVDEVCAVGWTYLKVAAITLWGYVVTFVVSNALQGLKRPMTAVWVGVFRQFFAPIAFIYLLTEVWDWGLSGVWWGVFVSTWGGALLAWCLLARTLRQREREEIPG